MNILLIDDEASIREPVAIHLGQCGHSLKTAASGEEGLWILEDWRADLVITDIKMPGLSGIDVLRAVRDRWPETEVVLITGYGTMEDALEALRLGAYDFLLKPVRLARLELLVRHCEERIRFSRDNRELREVVERLRELASQKEKFIALANHEMRTPTTVASGFVALLAERANNLPEDLRRLVLGADQALRRMKEVVEDLGDLGLSQTGRLQLQLSRRPVREYTDGVAEVCGMYRSLRALTIRTACAVEEDLPVVADRRKLLRAVSALIQNAVKYTEDGGDVSVSLGLEREHLVFEVADTGVGVSEEEKDKIFEPFYETADVRYHRTSRHAFGGGGLGVGLPLARAIAGAHGGTVEYRAGEGRGSIFSLRVPLAGPGHDSPEAV